MGRCNERCAKPVAPAVILRCLLLTSFTLAQQKMSPAAAAAAAAAGGGCCCCWMLLRLLQKARAALTPPCRRACSAEHWCRGDDWHQPLPQRRCAHSCSPENEFAEEEDRAVQRTRPSRAPRSLAHAHAGLNHHATLAAWTLCADFCLDFPRLLARLTASPPTEGGAGAKPSGEQVRNRHL